MGCRVREPHPALASPCAASRLYARSRPVLATWSVHSRITCPRAHAGVVRLGNLALVGAVAGRAKRHRLVPAAALQPGPHGGHGPRTIHVPDHARLLQPGPNHMVAATCDRATPNLDPPHPVVRIAH